MSKHTPPQWTKWDGWERDYFCYQGLHPTYSEGYFVLAPPLDDEMDWSVKLFWLDREIFQILVTLPGDLSDPPFEEAEREILAYLLTQ